MADANSITVLVTRKSNRRYWTMYYVDPVTERQVSLSTNATTKKDALIAAGKWQQQLDSDMYHPRQTMSWANFRERFEERHLSNLSWKSQEAYATALNHLQRLINPARLATINRQVLSDFISLLKDEGAKPTSINSYLRHIKAVLNWAKKEEFIQRPPEIALLPTIKGKRMRSRPPVEEEFERMLAAVVKIRPHDAKRWRQTLQGLWISGLRIGEATILSWDADADFHIDLSGVYPAYRIYGEAQKSRQDQLLPMPPDAAEFFLATPPEEREGLVFDMKPHPTSPRNMTVKRAVRVISAIGRAAGVVVNTKNGKCVSAHDLRRAFATRWAKRGTSIMMLKELMRHSSIETTERYYVDIQADDVAAQLHSLMPREPISGQFSGHLAHAAQASEQPEVQKPIIPREIRAEGRGLEPPTPCGAPDFESGC